MTSQAQITWSVGFMYSEMRDRLFEDMESRGYTEEQGYAALTALGEDDMADAWREWWHEND